jgi:UDP-N-acetylmuramate dehydrogenase
MRAKNLVELAPLTTLRVGGQAARFAELESDRDVADAVRDAEARGEPLFVLGGGSNVVIGDQGLPGLVVRVAPRGIEVREEGSRVIVDAAAGEAWDGLVVRAVDEKWSGVACMSGIPGLVGGTPIQNVGAYGQEVADSILGVRAFDRAVGDFVYLPAPACGFGYRASRFKRSARWIVTSVRFGFPRAQATTVRYAELATALGVPMGAAVPEFRAREAVLALRRGKGMVLDDKDPESVSAGSFFVNPIVPAEMLEVIVRRAGEAPPRMQVGEDRAKVPAAWLVERAGFAKGWTLGRAGLSRKHALALVNRGGATAHELLLAARTIAHGVHARFGIELAPEPVLMGCSWEDEAPAA